MSFKQETPVEMEVLALATENTSGIFKKTKIPRHSPGPNDVLINIKYAGICHSDLHQARAEWPINCWYPMVPGHEIAGLVEEVGSAVTKYKVGQRVGVGCFVDSCRTCESCQDGHEQYCTGGVPSFSKKFNKQLQLGNVATYNCCIGDDAADKKGMPEDPNGKGMMYGGYSQKITVDESYVCFIPDSIDLQVAAPLLCAGITVYSPLVYYGAKKAGEKFTTGIVGLGGLGAMGVKIAKAMGNNVYAVSSSERKRDLAEKELGVKYINSNDADAMAKHALTFDLIVCTISANFDIHHYLGLMKAQSTFCLVGLPPDNMPIAPFAFVARRIQIGGSLIGGIQETQDMLDFCAEHKISSDVEVIPAKDVNVAWKSLSLNTNTKSRYVIDVENTLVEGDWECVVPEDIKPHKVHEHANIFGAYGDKDSVAERLI